MKTKYVITHMKDRLFTAEYEDNQCVGLNVIDQGSIVGNICIGRVANVVKNINCAFIEIQPGIQCYYSLEDNKKHLFINRKNNAAVNIGDLMLLQVEREAMKTKPATVTSRLSISGSFVVICSDFSGVMISGKTKGNAHCKKIKEQLTEAFSFQMDSNNETPIGCNSYGFILRTNSKDAPFETVLAEANSLLSQYQRILKQATYGCAYETLYRNEPEYLEHIKGIPLIQEIEIVTDDISIYNAIQDGLPELIPTQLRLYNDSLLPLYKLYSLETELEKALNRKIWLKSGGTLIIEQTEALTVVDVNTGKYVTKKQGEQGKRAAIMQINMEAAIEIARQIRLRNISGIIIVDFINMKYDDDINELITCLKRILKSDKIKTTFIDMTKLGLVEITRKKSGKSLKEAWYGEFNDN